MNEVRIAAVIPARMDSSRYPGKPMIEIGGLPMVEHVRRRTLMCDGFSDVVVATCDREIFNAVKHYGGDVMMTSKEHIMASDRVAEAAEQLDCTHVVNVQGDEILVLPEDLLRLVKAINDAPEIMFWNAISSIENRNELSDSSIVKCVITAQGNIMYCSRDFSLLKLNSTFNSMRKILGILGYSIDALLSYSDLPRTPLEITESIDQFRIIENGHKLCGVVFSGSFPGINEPREEEIVRGILNTNIKQKKILKQIL